MRAERCAYSESIMNDTLGGSKLKGRALDMQMYGVREVHVLLPYWTRPSANDSKQVPLEQYPY